MKTILFSSMLFLLSLSVVKGQYVINFSNPATYFVDCGNVVSSQWSVKNQTCELLLPPMVLTSSSSLNVAYDIRINQSGNLDPEDLVIVHYKINSNAWQVDSIIAGDNTNSVRTIFGAITISVADTVHFRISMKTNANNEFWSVKSGDISILNVRPIYFPLPVQLYSFDGTFVPETNSNLIQWSTVSETNNSHFTLYKSLDGKNFSILTTINGAGNSNSLKMYEFEDFEVSEYTYYKLIQTDFDGQSEEFSPIVVKSSSENNPIELNSVYALGENIQLSINTQSDQRIEIRFLSLSGQILYENFVLCSPGVNMFSFDNPLSENSIGLIQLSSDKEYILSKKIFMSR